MLVWNRSVLRGVHSHMTDRTDTRALRARVDAMLDALTRQNEDLTALPERLAAITAQVRSADDLVGVVVDGTGVPVRVGVAPDAFRRSTPEQLGDAVTAAARHAAAQAREIARELVVPVLAVADEMPDLSDLVPGAPSLRPCPRLFVRSEPSRIDEPAYGASILMAARDE